MNNIIKRWIKRLLAWYVEPTYQQIEKLQTEFELSQNTVKKLENQINFNLDAIRDLNNELQETRIHFSQLCDNILSWKMLVQQMKERDSVDVKQAMQISDYIDGEQAAIIYAYRYLLNREPENKKLIINNESDWHQLRERFMTSDEYKSLNLDRISFSDMPYHSLIVKGIVYFFDKQDMTIPNRMIVTGENWAEDDIKSFLRIVDLLVYENNPPKNGVFLDIGGNIGTTTIFCKSKIKPELRYIGFEPVSVLSRLFAANVAFNGIPDVVVENIGLSNQNQDDIPLVINHNNWGNSRIDFDKQEESDELIQVTTLDSYMNEHDLKSNDIKYIWLDVEGHEPEVLEGAAALYKENRVPACIEFNQGIYMEQGKYEKTLILLGEYFRHFIVCSNIGTDDEKIRPISELNQLWEEFDGKSCDLILM